MHGEALLQVAPASSGAQVSAYSGRRRRTAVQPDTGGRGLPAEDIQGMGDQGDSCWGVGEGGKWIDSVSGGIKYCIWPDHVHRLCSCFFVSVFVTDSVSKRAVVAVVCTICAQ